MKMRPTSLPSTPFSVMTLPVPPIENADSVPSRTFSQVSGAPLLTRARRIVAR
jgi:hypothetical protein